MKSVWNRTKDGFGGEAARRKMLAKLSAAISLPMRTV